MTEQFVRAYVVKLGNNVCPSALLTRDEVKNLATAEEEIDFNMNLSDLKDHWNVMLEWAKEQIAETTDQERVFGVFSELNNAADHFNQDFGGNGYFDIPTSLQEIAQKRLWQIKHPVSAAIAMGETQKVDVNGTVLVYLKKEVNVI